jgi:hypothetical protein
MAIGNPVFQNSKTEAAVNNTTITFTALENDVVAVGIMSSATTDRTFSMADGTWSKIDEVYSNDAEDTNLAAFIKRMGASPDTSATLTISGTAVTLTTIVNVYRDVDTTTAQDATATTATQVNGATPTPAGITTNTDGAKVVTFIAATQAVAVTTPSTGYGNLLQEGTGGASTRTLVVQDKTVATAGLETPGGITDLNGSTDQSSSTITFALRPAVSAGAYTIDAAAASYTYSATDAAVEHGHLIDAAAASYAWTAQDATLTRDIPLSAEAAAYAWTANDAGLEYVPIGSTYTLDADAAAYLWSATDADLVYVQLQHYSLDADSAAYTYTASDAGLEYSGAATAGGPVTYGGGGAGRDDDLERRVRNWWAEIDRLRQDNRERETAEREKTRKAEKLDAERRQVEAQRVKTKKAKESRAAELSRLDDEIEQAETETRLVREEMERTLAEIARLETQIQLFLRRRSAMALLLIAAS